MWTKPMSTCWDSWTACMEALHRLTTLSRSPRRMLRRQPPRPLPQLCKSPPRDQPLLLPPPLHRLRAVHPHSAPLARHPTWI